LVENRANVNVLYESLNPAFQDFLEMQTLASMQQLLSDDGKPVSVRRIVFALGILLQPVMSAGSAGIGKGLVLPLPADPMYRNLVGCLWMDLLCGFLGRADFELLMLMRRRTGSGHERHRDTDAGRLGSVADDDTGVLCRSHHACRERAGRLDHRFVFLAMDI